VAAEVFIDNAEVQTVSGSVTRRMNAPSQGIVTVPMHLATGASGSRVKIYLDGTLALHGRAIVREVSAGEDTGYVQYNVTGPMELWEKRPARDADGDFSNPTFIEDFQTAPQILEQILVNSEDAGDIPDDAEGPLRVQIGSFATGGVSVEGAPVDWPMTIAEVASLLISTGQLDIVETPIDVAGNMARIDGYNGNYGTDRTGEIILEYAMGARNVGAVRWNTNMENLVNKLWYYLGPRVKTENDPGGVQHWRANVVSTSPMPDPPKSAVNARRVQSQADYDVRMEIQIFDARGDEATVGRELYWWQWLAESWLRALPHELVHVTPQRGAFTFGDFAEGDLVTVRAGAALCGGFSGAQRIYAYTASWDGDGVLAISELQTSPGNEGFA
jgi:hypothetical protein